MNSLWKKKLEYIRDNRKTTHFLDSCIRISIISYGLAFLFFMLTGFFREHSTPSTILTALAAIALICGVVLAGYANCNSAGDHNISEDLTTPSKEEMEELQQMLDDYKCNMDE